jgi:hypothetical protein
MWLEDSGDQLFEHSYKVCLSVCIPTLADHSQLSSAVEDAALSNIQAVSDLSDSVRSTFGPNCTLSVLFRKRNIINVHQFHRPQQIINQ